VAFVIAHQTRHAFEQFSAVTSGIAEVREAVKRAKERRRLGQRTVLFVDEIHRFNKAQQDAFLPHVEDGTVVLIGATTENPYFSVVGPLISRSRIFVFEPLSASDMKNVLKRAVAELGDVSVTEDGVTALIQASNGDARFLLTTLEVARDLSMHGQDARAPIDAGMVERAAQRKMMLADRAGDAHYDLASAFIKSMRGSDPDATLYYLARLIEAGEDPRFIARRIMIHAAEDVGMADPMALVVATSAAEAADRVGFPEARIILAEAALYVALAPKSNAVVTGIDRARQAVREGETGPVPKHLRDAHYPGAEPLAHGRDYKYPHDYPDARVEQEYLPDGVSGHFWQPTERDRNARNSKGQEGQAPSFCHTEVEETQNKQEPSKEIARNHS
jgi:putative ATPase